MRRKVAIKTLVAPIQENRPELFIKGSLRKNIYDNNNKLLQRLNDQENQLRDVTSQNRQPTI